MTEKIGKVQVEENLKNGILAKERKDFGRAAEFFTNAIIHSEEIGYPHGVLHGLLNIGTIWKLKARETGKRSFARLGRLSFLEARDYARDEHMDPEEIIHATFLLGQAEFELGNFSEAISLYKEAHDFYQEHPRSIAHTGDVQRHLGTAMVKAGQVDDGITTIQEGLAAIRTFDEVDAFDKRNYVWETGALLALAEVYLETDLAKSQELAQEALAIAKREELVIRKQEATKLLGKLHI